MPLSDFSGGELSSRHLPDVSEACSNTSFSFQILGTSDNLLADEDADDFFRDVGTDISMAVAGLSRPHVGSVGPLDERWLSKDFLEKDSRIMEGDMQKSNFIQETFSNLGEDHDSQSTIITSLEESVPATGSRPVVEPTSHSDISVPSNTALSVSLVVNHTSGLSVPMTTQSTGNNQKSQPTATGELVQKSNIKEIKANKGKKEERTESEGQKRGLRKQQKVIERGITKSASRFTRSRITRNVSCVAVDSTLTPNALTPISKVKDSEKPTIVVASHREDGSPDMSSSSIFAIGGVAARLMQYGQNYIETFGGPLGIGHSTNEFIQSKKSDEGSNTDTVMARAKEVKNVNQDLDTSDDDRDKPLTLLQLSPRKRPAVQNIPLPPSPNANPDVLPSTRRLSNKRPMTLDSTSEAQQNRKRKRPEVANEEMHIIPKKEPNARPRLPSSRLQTRTVVKPRSNSASTLKTVSGSGSGPKPPTREIRKAKRIVSQPAVFNPGTGWDDGVRLPEEKSVSRSNSNLNSTSSSNLRSLIKSENDKEGNILLPSSSSSNNQSVTSKSDAKDCVAGPQNENVEAQRPHSRSVSRSQSSQSQKHRFYHPAPDFKALHTALDASLAQRKENIRPVVPLSIQLETDMRMQERKRFDERVKEKFKQKEREEEERRRICQEEEEKEIKELRKNLVIKAHEVPEWYKTMPKTKESVEN